MACPPTTGSGSSGGSGGSGGSGAGQAVTSEDERLIVLAKKIAPDIRNNVDGASVCKFGFTVADSDDLQIIVQPMDQIDEPHDRDGMVIRTYVIWVVTHETIARTNVQALTNAGNLVLRMAKRYVENMDLEDLEILEFIGCIVYDKQFFPFYDQKELDTTDTFHSVIQLRFREHI